MKDMTERCSKENDETDRSISVLITKVTLLSHKTSKEKNINSEIIWALSKSY